MPETRQRALLDRPVEITIHITVPSVTSVLLGIVAFISRYQVPLGSTRNLVRRQMSLLAVFACAMCAALIVTNETGFPSPLRHAPWDIIYTGMFLVAGILAAAYWILFTSLSRAAEFYLRMSSFGLAFSASLGWGMLTVLGVVVYTHDWVRVAPWIFITLYFGRALATYIEFIDMRAIRDMKTALHDV